MAARAPQKRSAGEPALERPHKGLTETQEIVADLASRMILYGGAREDIEMMLTALARHQWRNYSFMRRSSSELPKRHLEELVAEWYSGLHDRWAKKADLNERPGDSPAKTVRELVRANLRTWCQDHFEEFLTAHGLEEVWLLNEILDVTNGGWDFGEAIWTVMDRADLYVRVPYEHKNRVKRYVALLAGEQTGEATSNGN